MSLRESRSVQRNGGVMSAKALSLFVFMGLAIDWHAVAASEVELGMDGGVSFTDTNVDFFVDVPVQQFRVGVFVNNRLSIEPAFSFEFVDAGNQSVTSLDLHGSVLFHFPSDRTKTHGFIGGGPGMTYINVDSDFFGGEDTAWGFTVQGGIKVPVRKALALRFGGSYERSFESDVDIGSVRGGVSFFTGD